MNVPKPRLRAFTLIELLIVITIIGILAVALVPRIIGGPAKARDAQRKAALQQISTALELYADDNQGEYPVVLAPVCVSTLAITSYLTTIPADPQSAGMAWCGGGYGYSSLDGGAGYMITALLESDTQTGPGVVDGDTFAAAFAAGSDYSTNYAALDECSGVLCQGGTVYYVTGR